MSIKPIGPVKTAVSGKLSDLPPLLLGGAVFNQQFNDNPEKLPIKDILRLAFNNGVTAIDTSPYYGPSELLLGAALEEIKSEFPRDQYYIVTKAGRVQLDDFDYSAEHIRKSVLRSLERLHTDYLDLVYLHDVEFVSEEGILEALTELRKLKDEGIIRHFGISGYPVDFIYHIASKVVHVPEIGSLDAVMSYSNFNLQNEILRQYIPKFYQDAQLKKLLNASILSMSLLRSGSTHSFHPASDELKKACKDTASALQKEHGIELADLATRYAIREFLPFGNVVLGVSTVEELKNAIVQYWNVKDQIVDDTEAVAFVKKSLGEHLDETWESETIHYSTKYLILYIYSHPTAMSTYHAAVILISEVELIHTYTPLIQKALDSLERSDTTTLDIIITTQINKLNQLDKILAETYTLTTEIIELSGETTTGVNVTVLYNDHYKELKSVHWDLLLVDSLDQTACNGFQYKHKHSIETIRVQRSNHEPVKIHLDSDESEEDIHRVVAVGGTFDHFHDGHKILLTAAAFICSERLIIGVTDQELLMGKKYQEYIQSYDTRVQSSVMFLNRVKPNLTIDPIAIRDVCGPTGYIADIDALVVSRETIKGGEFVNATRRAKQMKELQVHVINVIGGEEEDGFKNKLSSTQLRRIKYEGVTHDS
ncbi:hypothetical protein WICPIJ_009133 [Wickerhamomyces pijperi]|uniref:Cytidyltransferase-like domain-containing protein n=1 Tax=Wickerhamomyces pijperi TaxID=599730 RepID=A0A9P8PQD3_WICPI|nr:hypothetical protein WICPIJ_009133 [Wickerhamomyces pijperi]